MNLFTSLELGKRALFASSLALDVAGENIANVNTPGYTRRRVELSEAPGTYQGRLYLGSGVSAETVTRVVDRLLEAQVRSEQEGVGRQTATSDGLSQIEQLLNESGGGGLSSAFSAFYSSWSSLAGSADSAALRRAVVSSADTLAATIRRQAAGLAQIRTQADQGATDTLTRVSALTKDIADLNGKISSTEAGGAQALDLRDARSQKLRELAGLVDINVADGPKGSVYVALAGTGDTLVVEDRATAPAVTRDATGLARLVVNRGGASVDITDRIRGGTLGGQLHLRDDLAAGYQSNLDKLAADLISRVNTLHAAGLDAHGQPGGSFFAPTAPGASAAATIAVSSTVLADSSLVAAGGSASVGDGSNALAIAGLESQTSAALGGRTHTAFLAELQTSVGNDAQTASSGLQTAQSALTAADSRLQSLSGVSPDEEAAALLQYQRSYEAAARFIATVNEMTKVALDQIHT